jgi:hypothetical protein
MDGRTTSFQNYDDEAVYNAAIDHETSSLWLNFVIEFGKDKPQIAFDVGATNVQNLLQDRRDRERFPVRWM